MPRPRRRYKRPTLPTCEFCGDVIDDWEAPTGYRYEGRRACRWCYLERVSLTDDGTEGKR